MKYGQRQSRALLLGVGLGAAFPLSTELLAQDQRDEDIFGSEAKSGPSPDAEAKRKAVLSDSLQIGGRLELRMNQGVQDQQSFSKGALSQEKTADLYFDSRPNKDVRVFLRTRLSEASPKAANTDPDVSTALDEFWFKWDYNDLVYFTYGKQHLKWGSGRFWNPTDFTAQEVRDPLALFDRRLGQELLKIHIPQEKSGHNYYLILQSQGAVRSDDLGVALRGEWSVGSSAEVALSAYTRRGSAQKLGFDLSTALGPLDLNIELATQKRLSRTFYRGEIDPTTLQLPESYQVSDRFFQQGVLGIKQTVKYSDDDSLTYGLEGFVNQLGYKDRELELYSLIQGQSQSLYAGDRYLAAYVLLPSPGSWNKSSWFFNALENLGDRTTLARVTATYTLYDQATLEVYVGRCFGEYGELCFQVPQSYKSLAELPGISEDLKRIVALLPTRKTNLTTGLSLSMNF